MAQQRPIDRPAWATGGINLLPDFQEPLSVGPGYIALQRPPFLDWNTIWNRNYTWGFYYDENIAQIKDIAGGGNTNRHSLSVLGYPTNNGSLTETAFTGGTYWLNGTRVEFDLSRLQKIGEVTHTFPPNRDTYISAQDDGDSTLSFIDVPAGDPEPAPPAGFINIVRVRSDALELIQVLQLLPDTVSTLYPWYFEVLCSGEQAVFEPINDTTLNAGEFTSTGTGDAVNAQGDAQGAAFNGFHSGSGVGIRVTHIGTGNAGFFAGNAAQPTLFVTGTNVGLDVQSFGATTEAINANSFGGPGIITTSSAGEGIIASGAVGLANGYGVLADADSSLAAAVRGDNADDDGVSIQGVTSVNATNLGVAIDGFARNDGTAGRFRADTGLAIAATSDFNTAVIAKGGLSANAHGIVGLAGANGLNWGVFGFSAANAGALGGAVAGLANTLGVAGSFISEDNHAVSLAATGTDRAALRIAPQATAPAIPGLGDLSVNSSNNSYVIYDGSEQRQLWGSNEGILLKRELGANVVIPAVPTSFVTLNLNVPAGSVAIVTYSADFSVSFVDVADLYVDIDLQTSAGTVRVSRRSLPGNFLGSASGFSFTTFVEGPVTSFTIVANKNGWPGNVEIVAPLITAFGLFNASDIQP